jgi:chitinase
MVLRDLRNWACISSLGVLFLMGCGHGSAGTSPDAAAEAAEASQPSDGGGLCEASDPIMFANRRVVAYFPLELGGVYDLTSVDYSIVTHVIEHAVCTDQNGNLNLTDLGKEFPVPNFVTDVHAGGAKALLGLCADTGNDVFGAMASQESARATYVKNVMALVTQYGFDGLDIDWEFPASSSDETALTALITQLRQALGTSRSLSITGPPESNFGQYYDFSSLIPQIDWFGAQTYGYAGPTESSKADLDTPLYSVDGAPSVEGSVAYYLGQGVPPQKLLIGVIYYGRLYSGANELGEHLLNHRGNNSVDYSAIVPLIGNGWTLYRDVAAGVPYLLQTDHDAGVITYDDPTSIQAKCNFAATHCLGGTVVWNLGQDVIGNTQPLLEATRVCR